MSSSSLSPDQAHGVRQKPTPEQNELSFLEVVVGVEITSVVCLLIADIIIRERQGWEVVGETFIALCLVLWLLTITRLPVKPVTTETTEQPEEPPQVLSDDE